MDGNRKRRKTRGRENQRGRRLERSEERREEGGGKEDKRKKRKRRKDGGTGEEIVEKIWRRAKLHAYICNGTECSYGTGSILVLLPSHVLGQAGREEREGGEEGEGGRRGREEREGGRG